MCTLEIPKEIFSSMVAQAREQAPIEACGILAGTGFRVRQFYPMANRDQSTDHFMMQPEEQFAAMKDVRRNGLEILAIYHSHPETPARPSAEDIRLALTPGVRHVILSLQNRNKPKLRAFRIEDGVVLESPVKIVEDV